MTSIMRLGLATAVVGSIACGAGRADAAFVTYTETVTASGSLGTTSFTNALVTFIQTADTSNVITNSAFSSVNDITSTVSVAGVGTASFTNPTFTADQPGLAAGLGQGTAGVGGPIVISTSNAAFDTYDLRSSIGPLSGTAFSNSAPDATSLGALTLTSTPTPSTFQANVVPEPSSLALCGLASLVGLGYARARRRSVLA